MEMIISSLAILRRWVKNASPYLMLEILMPGGTLLALLLFLYRRWSTNVAFSEIRDRDVDFGFLRTTMGWRDKR